MSQMMMQPQEQYEPFTFVFADSEEGLTSKDLSGYLYYFRCIYAIIQSQSSNISAEWILSNKVEFLRNIETHIKKHGGSNFIHQAHSVDLGRAELKIDRIKKESPLEIVIVGSVVCLVAAAIISGGEVDLKVAKFKLNPIGDGLKIIRDLFRD